MFAYSEADSTGPERLAVQAKEDAKQSTQSPSKVT